MADSGSETASEDRDELTNVLYTALAVNAQAPNPISKRFKRRCPLVSPVTFHDRHLDERLQLKYIEHIPLDHMVSHTIHITLESLKSRNISLPDGAGEGFFSYNSPGYSQEILDAPSIAAAYRQGMSTFASNVASLLLLDLPSKRDCQILLWRAQPGKDRSPWTAYTDAFGLEAWVSGLTDELHPILDPKVRALFDRAKDTYPALAWWETFILSEDTEAVIKAIGGDSSGPFDHEHCQTSGFRPPSVSTNGAPPDDASVMPWGLPLVPFWFPEYVGERRQLRRSLRLQGKARIQPRKVSSEQKVESVDAFWADVTIPRGQDAQPLADQFTLRAWARAVEQDNTFIIFYNGQYERIGLRHRASQTLFLSPIIDAPNCLQPCNAYLHTGLFLSIVLEAADRLAEQGKPNPRKRRRDADNEEPGRRYKTRAANVREQNAAEEKMKASKIVKRHAITRSLVLLEMRYGVWNSPAPSAFVRTETMPKTTYTSHEYMSLVLTSKIAQGGTGVAHTARLEILVGGRVTSLEVVVKIAFYEKQIQRLRHEHEIYKHLYAHGVKEGIPYDFGLFDDVETGAAALILSHEGTCLLYRPVSELSQEIKSSFARILDCIHRAGVRHRDIQRQNLTLGDDDKPAIIDFDRAKVEPTEIKKKIIEMDHIKEIMNGGNDYPWMSASTPSTESSHPSDNEGSADEDIESDDDQHTDSDTTPRRDWVPGNTLGSPEPYNSNVTLDRVAQSNEVSLPVDLPVDDEDPEILDFLNRRYR